MNMPAGIVAALIALLAWGFGDFFIQKTIRLLGRLESLFLIGAFSCIVLLPFVWRSIPSAVADLQTFSILVVTFVISFGGAMVLFTALKHGKISVVLPVFSSELLITVLISVLVLHETVTVVQLVLAGIVFLGILLIVVHRDEMHWWQRWKTTSIYERGIVLAAIAAVFSSLNNIFTAISSRLSDPLTAIWFIHTGLGITSCIWLIALGKFGTMLRSIPKNWKLVLGQSSLDNIAWVAYAKAVTALPIAVTVAITESFIGLAALLGIFIGKEKVNRTQVAGIVLTLIAATILTLISG
ncbi:MAG: hypothetical protein A3B31_03395 [Candidatus Komeilibacteria bacterium RIFCSPLOWO2_01_FULL_53_11]|uniref:EamA domain-containing protein n=1 Tax=Candidatus Komeilibacteria bacterium RIFCSPLOWO2_01_FULL_53_11 TaxID=1798552 RepID=A0A1G2BTA4_9BACT|nr:MAG: hypothetical protein A3B31_03395 [Candidatus Komeilibacteria bacterium RIFCSPLOWO2_01_FULL_53_11]